MENRVLIHAPRGRDAQVIAGVLSTQGIACLICPDTASLLAEMAREAAAAIVTEEVLGEGFDTALGQYLAAQPAWSDFPFVVMATRQSGRRSARAVASLQELGNIVLLERPVNPETLASAARSAVRARTRQYATRKHLAAIEASKQVVEALNGELESRIQARTADLASANDRLMHEIAERERAQASVVQGQKLEAIGRLTGGMAHDFNNLLHVVNMNLQFIARMADDEKLGVYARRAREAVSRGSRLTAQLLSFARAQSLLPKLNDVNALIGNMRELIEVSVGSRIRVELHLAPGSAPAVLDSGQLEMAVLNMSVNSRDAMPDGGTLSIRTEIVSDGPAPTVRVSVSDTGAGIPPSLLTKVFDPFFTTKPVGKGTGLGLSQVYGFARQSGGTSEIRSEVGRGTTVMLRFPLAQAEEAEAIAQLPAAGVDGHPDQQVLVVEDDAQVRQGIVECLRLLGYTVHEATDGAAGLHALERHRPDLLLVDYLMPGMNGAELITAARRLHPGMPILLATGYADMAQVEKVIGRQSVLAKPFDLETLGAAVASELRGQTASTAAHDAA
ncbi:response regulator [Xylophilus sp. GOD-11R]|uniref:response regulator n=1 Tax=Xylophilus sp. GOD-11R TaxID=3089814 RepID=UPI00298D2B80|nr:response regulator [Xylophilus sp. GOD-11R]WPB56960.1 response regulator [Xylophilus sp. GOD-11R]